MSETTRRGGDGGAAEASRYLFELLGSHPAYRRRWERLVVTRREGRIHHAAVARVVAAYLVDTGERSIYADGVDRQLKDRVGRAAGGRMSAETLRWFVEAFEMEDDHAARLWALFSARRGQDGAALAAAERPLFALEGQFLATETCRSVALHELHHLGPDGLPAWHRTIQVLRAETDGVDRYVHRFDANTASVEVLRGGRAGQVTERGGGFWGVDLLFERPLTAGETVSLEYVTRFEWHEAPPPQLRRAALRRLDNLELRVQFHPDRMPARVRWAEWSSLEGPIVRAEDVAVERDGAVHRYLERVERTIVGFTWDWPPASR